MVKQNGKASIIEILPNLGQGGEPFTNVCLFERLSEGKVEVYTNSTCTGIGEATVRYSNKGRECVLEEIDQVILAAGVRENNTLAEVGKRIGIHTISIGDANGVKDGLRGIREAFDTVMSLC